MKWLALDEFFDIRNGYTPSKRNPGYRDSGSVPWFRMEDIRQNGRVLSSALQSVTLEAAKFNPFPANSIIISTSATIGEHALITVNFLANQRFTCITLKKEYEENFDIKFLFYYCYELGRYCNEGTRKGKFAAVDMAKFKLFRFPMPPLDEQQRIVSILDRFEALCNDLTNGLPAEITARRKQYEYYRDKLLTFREKP